MSINFKPLVPVFLAFSMSGCGNNFVFECHNDGRVAKIEDSRKGNSDFFTFYEQGKEDRFFSRTANLDAEKAIAAAQNFCETGEKPSNVAEISLTR